MAQLNFDVFLSHSGADKLAVEALAHRLEAEGIGCWLDKWNLVPGEPWQEAIEDALDRCATCAVFLGPGGIGPWENEEMRAALERRVAEAKAGPEGRPSFRVIPVWLPGSSADLPSPRFLRRLTWVRFERSLDEEDAFHRLLSGIRGVSPGASRGLKPTATATPPYRGLRAFDISDAPYFFGREEWVERLLQRLDGGIRFLAVVGPSGSGKSSLARAGLLAALRAGRIEGSGGWPQTICRPGAEPLLNLAGELSGGGVESFGAVRDLAHGLAQDRGALHLAVQLALRGQPEETRFVLLVDQLEELFTHGVSEKNQKAFLDNLHYAATVAGGHTLVIATLRADFYGRLADHPLAKLLPDHHVLLGRMTPEELRLAIEAPAQKEAYELESGLIELLLRDVEGQPGYLPLLQHALYELWERRNGRRMTVAAYRNIGGVAGALKRRAEEVFESLSQGEREICRRILLCLTQPAESGSYTRRRARFEELAAVSGDSAAVEPVLRPLTAARLVVAAEVDGSPWIEVAHEAIIQHWDRLQGWLFEDQELLLWRQRLRGSIAQWETAGQEEGALLHGALLSEAERWLDTRPEDLTEEERRFIRESVAYRERSKAREESRKKREIWTLRIVTGVITLFLLGVSLALWFAVQQRNRATARYLAAQSDGLRESRHQTAALLALEAFRLTDKAGQPRFPPIEQALRQALLPFGGRVLGSYRGLYRKIVASPDRTWVAGLGVDGKVRVWNLSTADPASSEQVFPGTEGEPSFFEISPANRWLLIGTPDARILRLERLDGPSESRRVSLPGRLLLASFSTDDHWLALRAESEGVRLHDLTAQTPERRFDFGTQVNSVAFSRPDGHQMATGIDDGTVHLWSLDGRAKPLISPSCGRALSALSFVPGADALVAADIVGTFWRWRWRGGEALEVIGGRQSNLDSGDLRVSRNGRWLVVWDADTQSFWLVSLVANSGNISVSGGITAFAATNTWVSYAAGGATWLFDIDEEMKNERQDTPPLENRKGSVRAIEIRNCCLVAGGDDLTAHLWRPSAGRVVLDAALGGHDGPVEVLGVDNDERWLLTSGSQGRPPRLWDIQHDPILSGEPLRLSRPDDNGLFGGLLLGIRGDQLLAMDWRGRSGSSALGTNKPLIWRDSVPIALYTIPGTTIWSGSLGPDGHRLAIPTYDDRILLFDLNSSPPHILRQLPETGVARTALDPMGRWLALGLETSPPSRNAGLVLWDLRKPTPVRHQRRGNHDEMSALAFSPDGHWLVSAGKDGVAHLWSLEPQLAEMPRVLESGGEITTAAFGTGGWLALAGEDRIVRLWQNPGDLASTAAPDQSLEGAAETILSLAFGPDSWMAAGGSEGTVYLWNRKLYPQTPIVLKKHRSPLRTVAFSPDGRWLVSADEQGEVFRWSMRDEDLEAFACQTVGRNLSHKEWKNYFPGQKYRQTCPDLPPGD